ncbi:MAG: hypothetical protein AAGA81_01840 [Acidobacteriota bacterium]
MGRQTFRTLAVFTLGPLVAGLALAQDAPRTPWGTASLNGVWDSGTLTPLERPLAMRDWEFLTEEEAEAIRGTGFERVMEIAGNTLEGKVTGELSEIWLGPPQDVVRTLRTSLVIDPPDGRIPFTAEGRQRHLWSLFTFISPTAPTDGPEVRHNANRCLMTGALYMPNPLYLNHHQIVQTEDYVVIQSELMETRIVPLGGEPVDPKVRQWNGISRGRWDGDTLVVETTNFSGQGVYFGATEGLRVVERFVRVDAETIDYQITFEDPSSFERPWTTENTLRAMEPPIYEFACHEGNYAMTNILRAARMEEREKAEKEEN